MNELKTRQEDSRCVVSSATDEPETDPQKFSLKSADRRKLSNLSRKATRNKAVKRMPERMIMLSLNSG